MIPYPSLPRTRPWAVLFLASLLLLLAACSGSTTMSPARQARIDACLKQCSAAESGGPDTPSSGSWNHSQGSYDTRNSCERACY